MIGSKEPLPHELDQGLYKRGSRAREMASAFSSHRGSELDFQAPTIQKCTTIASVPMVPTPSLGLHRYLHVCAYHTLLLLFFRRLYTTCRLVTSCSFMFLRFGVLGNKAPPQKQRTVLIRHSGLHLTLDF